KTPFKLAQPPDNDKRIDAAGQFSFGKEAACELVFIDGYYAPHFSRAGKLPRGLTVQSLAQAIANDEHKLRDVLGRHADVEKNPFVALNTGFIRDGSYIHASRGISVAGPIHLLFVSTSDREPAVSHPRVLLVAEDNVEAQIVESYVGASGAYFTNAVTEI